MLSVDPTTPLREPAHAVAAELSAAGREVVAGLADALLAVQESLIEELVPTLLERVPELRHDEVLASELPRVARANIVGTCAVLRDPGASVGAFVPTPSLNLGRTLARRGGQLQWLVEAYRLSQARLFEDLVCLLTAQVVDSRLLGEVLPYCSRRFNALVDAVLGGTIETFATERDRLRGSALAKRVRTVQAILEGSLRDERRASAALGHDLSEYQTAVIIWSELDDPPDDFDARLDALVHETSGVLGGTHALTVATGSMSTSAWVATRRQANISAIGSVRRSAQALGLQVAVGSSRSGIDGFVATHREALWANAFAGRSSLREVITAYPDVAALSLLHADQDQIRAFVRAELGSLAQRSEVADRLRETLRVVLEEGCNARLAAERLFAHKNTVLYRLRRAETLRGRPMSERRFELELALKLVHMFGDWALFQGAP